MLEIFMFVNPIGGVCLETERNIINSLDYHHQKARINVVPLTNLQIVNDYLERNELDLHDLDLRNHITNVTYASLLDLKAASFQGKKKARAFILSLQKHINQQHEKYSDTLIKNVVTEVGLDSQTFWEDRNSQLVKDLCDADRQLASELGVKRTPSTMLVDYRHNVDGDGILIEGCVSNDLIDQIVEDRLSSYQGIVNRTPFLQMIAKDHDHLRILK
ncbi:DsbA family protein [Lapidilactobacillus concavus]|nr:DsbA family protein [Lapidilactobacillus concavus]GEL14154.1 DsbA family protein [Lapidilactobacillus concavus]